MRTVRFSHSIALECLFVSLGVRTNLKHVFEALEWFGIGALSFLRDEARCVIHCVGNDSLSMLSSTLLGGRTVVSVLEPTAKLQFDHAALLRLEMMKHDVRQIGGND